jgi:hypothetical protein
MQLRNGIKKSVIFTGATLSVAFFSFSLGTQTYNSQLKNLQIINGTSNFADTTYIYKDSNYYDNPDYQYHAFTLSDTANVPDGVLTTNKFSRTGMGTQIYSQNENVIRFAQA